MWQLSLIRYWNRNDTMSVKNEGCIHSKENLQYNGYDRVYHNGKSVYAHRLAYLKRHGSIPKGKLVLHKCNVRNCINPKHLYAGTYKDNSNDCFKSGNHNFQTKKYLARGVRHGMSKMCDETVKEARRLYDDEVDSVAGIGRRFNVTTPPMRSIVKRKTWRHVKSPVITAPKKSPLS